MSFPPPRSPGGGAFLRRATLGRSASLLCAVTLVRALRLVRAATLARAVTLRRALGLVRALSLVPALTLVRAATLALDGVFALPEVFFDALFFCARRARFHALRAAPASLRARLASRLASFRRLRARLSSSFAIRTRCLATSACNRTRSRGSATEPCSLPVFFIGGSRSEGMRVSHKAAVVSSPNSYPQNLCITVWTDLPRLRKRRYAPTACVALGTFSPRRCTRRAPRFAARASLARMRTRAI